MPRRFEQLPDVYAPWADWHRSEDSGEEVNALQSITAENWGDWYPAERRLALAELRRTAPDAARELLAEKLPELSAEERLRIVETWDEWLSEDDVPLLQGFVKDRSGKVRRLIERYLGRIGGVEHASEDVSEFADYFSASKRSRGQCTVTAKPLKTKAQRKRRAELAEKLSLRSLVQALGLDNEVDLIRGWQHRDDAASELLVQMVAATGGESAAAELASKITTFTEISPDAFQLIFDRLGKEHRRDFLPRVLAVDDPTFSAAALCAKGLWGEVPLDQIESTCSLKSLESIADKTSANNHRLNGKLQVGLFSLGLLVDIDAAKELLRRFTEKRLFASDPMLGLLKLNACLPPGESP
jgi:hypothetical protein